jgi:hypothetical protein
MGDGRSRASASGELTGQAEQLDESASAEATASRGGWPVGFDIKINLSKSVRC